MFVKFSSRNHPLILLCVLLTGIAFPMRVYAQYVDCSGKDPNAFPTITAALAFAGPGSWITVVGTCNENVLYRSSLERRTFIDLARDRNHQRGHLNPVFGKRQLVWLEHRQRGWGWDPGRP